MKRTKRLPVISVSNAGVIKNREPNFKEKSQREARKRLISKDKDLMSFEMGVKKAIAEFKKDKRNNLI